MRALIQRVKEARVDIGDQTYSGIGEGMFVLLGVEESDEVEDVKWMASKVYQMRIFPDANQAMNRSLEDIQGDILVVSQFTLFASTKKGNRPGFTKAAAPEKAKRLYAQFVELIGLLMKKKVQTGVFGADMQIHLINDGPVTIWIDSKNKE